jgi:hypothetical protein
MKIKFTASSKHKPASTEYDRARLRALAKIVCLLNRRYAKTLSSTLFIFNELYSPTEKRQGLDTSYIDDSNLLSKLRSLVTLLADVATGFNFTVEQLEHQVNNLEASKRYFRP